jgi:hypothetical protein
LLQKGFDLTNRDEKIEASIWNAIIVSESFEYLNYFLTKGFDVNDVFGGRNWATPLSHAVRSYYLSSAMVGELLRLGAKPDAVVPMGSAAARELLSTTNQFSQINPPIACFVIIPFRHLPSRYRDEYLGAGGKSWPR